MDNENKDAIEAAIQKAIRERTFSMDIIERIEEMRLESIDDKERLQEQQAEIAKVHTALEEQKAANIELSEKVTTIVKREAACAEREKMCFTAEIAQAGHKASAEAYKHALETVFKPAMVRKSVMPGGYVHQNLDNSGTYSPGPDEITVTEG